MPGEGPMVIVTFYENFRYIENDISDVVQGLGTDQQTTRTFLITEDVYDVVKEKTPPFEEHLEKRETRSYTQALTFMFYHRVAMSVSATEGTWRIELQWNNYQQITVENPEGGLEQVNRPNTESDPIGVSFNAADILAALAGKTEPPLNDSGAGLEDPGDPLPLHMEVQVAEGEERPEEFAFHNAFSIRGAPGFIQAIDIGPNEVEFRLFLFGGFTRVNAETNVGVRMVNIDLAGVIEKVPEVDRVAYELPLEEGPCGPSDVEVPGGVVRAEGASSGRGQVGRKVGGNRA